MQHFLPSLLLWVSLSLAVAPCILAEQSSEDQPDPPRITGPHTEIEVRAEAPVLEGNYLGLDQVTFSRVSRDQLDQLLAYDLLTGLRLVPGVTISRYNLIGSYGGGEGGTLYIRGMGSGRPGGEIQFLVDGVPRMVGVWSHPLMDILGVDYIDEVDVVKGASPVLYGNTSFGAVEIRTRRQEQAGLSFDVSAAGGSHDTFMGGLNAGYRQGKVDVWLSAGYRHSTGHRPNAGGELQNYFGRFGLEPNPRWRLDVTFNHSNNFAQDPGAVSTGPPPRGQFNTDDWNVSVSLENSTGAWDGYTRFYRTEGAIRWQQWNDGQQLPEDSDTDYLNWGLRARQHWRTGDRLTVVFGLDADSYGGEFVHRVGSQATVQDAVRFWNVAPYALLEWHLGTAQTRVTPMVGLRTNVSRYFDRFMAPQAGLKVDHRGTELHASFSRGFNLPGVYAPFLYADWGGGDAWQELSPEQVWHVEAGVARLFWSRLKGEVTWFHDRVADALRFTAPPPRFDNIGDYTAHGLEFGLTFFPVEPVHVFTGYTWLMTDPERVPYTPRHSLTVGANYRPWRRLTLSLDAQYMDERWSKNPRYPAPEMRLDGFGLLNVRAQLDIAPLTWRERVIVFGAVENVTDAAYEYRPGYTMPGTVIFAGLKVMLK